jgi:class 3 adenylate cyclase
VFVPGLITHVEWMWEWPPYAAFLRRLASFRRLVVFDRRGMGLSDRCPTPATVEQQMDDIGAVMDAAGVERADLLGAQDGGVMALAFAASHPERVGAVITYSSRARFLPDHDYPWGAPLEVFEQFLEVIQDTWGQEDLGWIWLSAPSVAADEAHAQWFRQFQRLSAGPGVMTELLRQWVQFDLRAVLPAMRRPVLVLQRTNSAITDVGHGRYLADVLPEARLVELPGADEVLWAGDAQALGDEIQEFLTGVRQRPVSDRAFATVLFTDIVESTERAARMGDVGWRGVLDEHDRMAAGALREFRGRLVKSTGDGLLAVFDGPGRAVRCARTLRDGVRRLGIELRAGLHSGEVELRGQDVGGLAVHIASRVEALAAPGEVVVSRPTASLLVGEGLDLEERGEYELKGVPGRWALLTVA